MKDILTAAQAAFNNKAYNQAINLYLKAVRSKISEQERLNILKILCELYRIKSDHDAVIECAEEYLFLADQLNIPASKDYLEVKLIVKRTESILQEQTVTEQQKISKEYCLTAIGYWKSEAEPNFPHPQVFQTDGWNEEEKRAVINHLQSSSPIFHSRGLSWCRFQCGEQQMGNACLTDGYYIFPEGLSHYLEQHKVKLPSVFINHVKNYIPTPQTVAMKATSIDYQWWQGFAKNKH